MKTTTFCTLALCFSIALVSFAGNAHGVTLNLNMGEGTTGPVSDQEVIGGQIWNNLVGGGTDSTLQYANGSTATGVTATQAGSGSNSGDATGAGFGGSNALDSMTTSLVFSGGVTSTTLVVAGLPDGSVWDVTVWAGLNEATSGRTQTIDVNTSQVTGVGFHDQWVNGPLTFKNQVASGGFITLTNFDGNTTVEFAQGVSLVQVVPEPSTFALATLGVIGLACFRRRRR